MKINDEENFFVVSLLMELMNDRINYPASSFVSLPVAEKALP